MTNPTPAAPVASITPSAVAEPVHAPKAEPAATAEQLAFRNSRTYAQGWNAARKLTGGSAKEAGLNPYTTEPERARWNEGWTAARAKRA